MLRDAAVEVEPAPCWAFRNLEIHHLVHRADGGSHDGMNLVITCGSCHMAHHRGALTISGTAAHIEVERRREPTAHSPEAQARRSNAHVGAHAEPTSTDCKAADVEPKAIEATPIDCQSAEPKPVETTQIECRVAEAEAVEATPMVCKTAEPKAEARAAEPAAAEPKDAEVQAAEPKIAEPKIAESKAAASESMQPTAAGPASAASSKLAAAIVHAQTKGALVSLGWAPKIATSAVAAAAAMLGTEVALERLIREALRRCPMPRR